MSVPASNSVEVGEGCIGAISEVFDRSNALSLELSRMGSTLSTASQDVRAVVSDYKVARETFASIVDGLKGTVELAKREVGLTSDLVSRLEASAQKLIAAQTCFRY